tara:strand:+ start:242 stop:730 length:489 start_codon:yes stop_codon:yes gene_type:complete
MTSRELDRQEIHYIAKCNTCHGPGYNLREGGESGGIPNRYTKRKIRLSLSTGNVRKRRKRNGSITYQPKTSGVNIGSYSTHSKARRALRLYIRYRIRLPSNTESSQELQMRCVRAININTGIQVTFRNKQIAAESLRMSTRMINYILEGRYKQSKGWKFEHI